MSGDVGLESLESLQRHDRIVSMQRDQTRRELERAESRWQRATQGASLATRVRRREEYLGRTTQRGQVICAESLILTQRMVATAKTNEQRAIAQAKAAYSERQGVLKRFEMKDAVAEQVGCRAKNLVRGCREVLERGQVDNLAINLKRYRDVNKECTSKCQGQQTPADSRGSTADQSEYIYRYGELFVPCSNSAATALAPSVAFRVTGDEAQYADGNEACGAAGALERRVSTPGADTETESPEAYLLSSLYHCGPSSLDGPHFYSDNGWDSGSLSTESSSDLRNSVNELPTSCGFGPVITTAIKISSLGPEEFLMVAISKESNQSLAVTLMPGSEQARKLAQGVVRQLATRLRHGRLSVR